jgi:hypothetical protein
LGSGSTIKWEKTDKGVEIALSDSIDSIIGFALKIDLTSYGSEAATVFSSEYSVVRIFKKKTHFYTEYRILNTAL